MTAPRPVRSVRSVRSVPARPVALGTLAALVAFRALVPIAIAPSSVAAAGATSVPGAYAHAGPDGTTVFSDVPPRPDGSAPGGGARTSYAGSYGRPVATASCRGLEAAALDARGEALRADVEAAARRHGLDPSLALAVVRVESCFDVRARSVAGAEGLMQLMPATARELGVADAFSARANLDGGSRYLARMLERFGGDETLALAAYNAGPGHVTRHGGVPPFPETVAYVARVLAARARYRRAAPG